MTRTTQDAEGQRPGHAGGGAAAVDQRGGSRLGGRRVRYLSGGIRVRWWRKFRCGG